jgi:hypothetical protein
MGCPPLVGAARSCGARPGSEAEVPGGCEAEPVGAGDARSDLEVIPPCDTLVHFVGVTHPNPSNLGQFRESTWNRPKSCFRG